MGMLSSEYKNYKRRIKTRIGKIEFIQREINRRLYQQELLDKEIDVLIKRQTRVKGEIRNLKLNRIEK